jgi:uncharacterized membrane protein YedE/YeeE
MTLPVTGPALLPLGIVFGFAFGWLLQRARIADTNVIIAQLRLRDYTLFKVMLTAIIVGGVGIFFLHSGGLAAYHVKPANLAAVAVGAVLFGVGMALYGYCPGTGLAAIGTGSVHALIGAIGMIAGAIAFASRSTGSRPRSCRSPPTARSACRISPEFPTSSGLRPLLPSGLPHCSYSTAAGTSDRPRSTRRHSKHHLTISSC